MALLEVRDLTKIYMVGGDAETPALRGVTFSINKGEFVAIMGASGSGKSTLLHVIGFLDRHTGGEYLYDGKTFDDYTPDELARIRNKKFGFIFQAFHLLPRLSVVENVKLPLYYSDVPESQWDEMATKAVEAVGLGHRMHQESTRLSGGEKQRVAIARALVNNPEVIFADEPTGNLDSKSGKIIMEIIQKLSETEGKTVILITHETYTAEHAGRIIQLHDGFIASDRKVEHRHRGDDFIK